MIVSSSTSDLTLIVLLQVRLSPEERLLVQDVLELSLAALLQSGELVLRTELRRWRGAKMHLERGRWEVHLNKGKGGGEVKFTKIHSVCIEKRHKRQVRSVN